MKRLLSIGIILIFIGLILPPISGYSILDSKLSSGIIITLEHSESEYENDTTPPVTTHSLIPPEPNGLNGYYISKITVILNATDDLSGVNVTYYMINPGKPKIYTESFLLTKEGQHSPGYHSIDNAGNVEDWKYTPPLLTDLYPPYIGLVGGWEKEHGFWVYADVSDTSSGIDRVEFYIENKSMHVAYDYPYYWNYSYPDNHFVKAIVYDKAGHNASDEVFIHNLPFIHNLEHFPMLSRLLHFLGWS